MIRITELRNERELSQKDLALYFHVAQSTVSSWVKRPQVQVLSLGPSKTVFSDEKAVFS